MPNTRQIKQRINTAKNISKITKAMEMVSASKMRKAQQQALATKAYVQALNTSLETLSPMIDENIHPLLKKTNGQESLAIIVSTDKGLCGSLNQTLLKELTQWLKLHTKSTVIAIGKKAISFCNFYSITIFAQFSDLPDPIKNTDILPIAKLISSHFVNHEVGLVDIFYMDFVNTLVQKPKTLKLLPLASFTTQKENEKPSSAEYIFEPSAQKIFHQLLPYYLENSIYQAFLEARASEHSARMVTMKNANENANELIGELKLAFNKQRQATITNELLDIKTATLSLKG